MSHIPRILYVSASQYSGSTLASFLLNTHSNITTVGHTTGWHFGEDEEFLCSCGEDLPRCPYFTAIAAAFAAADLSFDYRDFGTAFRLAKNDRLNRYLVASLPWTQSSTLEHLRDTLVERIPGYAKTLRKQKDANRTFFSATLSLSSANVYVDNSHDPYRLRVLATIDDIQVSNLHLVRDPRGFALSCSRHADWSISLSTKLWLRRQSDIVRLCRDSDVSTLLVYYEDLCVDVDQSLARIHDFVQLTPQPFPGRFDLAEHHIIGNQMRLGGSEIRLDEKWKSELTREKIGKIDDILSKFIKNSEDISLREIVTHYLEGD